MQSFFHIHYLIISFLVNCNFMESSRQPFLPFVVRLGLLCHSFPALAVLSLAELFLLCNVPVPCQDHKINESV